VLAEPGRPSTTRGHTPPAVCGRQACGKPWGASCSTLLQSAKLMARRTAHGRQAGLVAGLARQRLIVRCGLWAPGLRASLVRLPVVPAAFMGARLGSWRGLHARGSLRGAVCGRQAPCEACPNGLATTLAAPPQGEAVLRPGPASPALCRAPLHALPAREHGA